MIRFNASSGFIVCLAQKNKSVSVDPNSFLKILDVGLRERAIRSFSETIFKKS